MKTYGRDGNGLEPDETLGPLVTIQPPVNGDWEVDPDIVNHPNPDDRLVVYDLRVRPRPHRVARPAVGRYVRDPWPRYLHPRR